MGTILVRIKAILRALFPDPISSRAHHLAANSLFPISKSVQPVLDKYDISLAFADERHI